MAAYAFIQSVIWARDSQLLGKLKYVVATMNLPDNVTAFTFRILLILCLTILGLAGFASKSLLIVTLPFEQLFEMIFAV